jgi:hypothetical protein
MVVSFLLKIISNAFIFLFEAFFLMTLWLMRALFTLVIFLFFIFYFWGSKALRGTLETVTGELFTIAWQSQPNLNPWSFLLLYFFEKRFSGQSFAILLNVEWVSWPIFGCGECINFYEFLNSQIMFLFYPSFFYFYLCIKTLECVFWNFSSSNLEKSLENTF